MLRQGEPSLGSPRLIHTGRKEKSEAKTHLKTHQPLCIFFLGRVGNWASFSTRCGGGGAAGCLELPRSPPPTPPRQAAAWTLAMMRPGGLLGLTAQVCPVGIPGPSCCPPADILGSAVPSIPGCQKPASIPMSLCICSSLCVFCSPGGSGQELFPHLLRKN